MQAERGKWQKVEAGMVAMAVDSDGSQQKTEAKLAMPITAVAVVAAENRGEVSDGHS